MGGRALPENMRSVELICWNSDDLVTTSLTSFDEDWSQTLADDGVWRQNAELLADSSSFA